MQKKRTRPAETPEVAAMLTKLSATLMNVAPTSHMFAEPLPQHTDQIRAQPAIGTQLKATSNLRSFHRDTVSEVLEKFQGHASPDSAVQLTSKLRFARPDDSIIGEDTQRPTALGSSSVKADGTFVPFQLGTGTLSRGALSKTYGSIVAAPPDAEVTKLKEELLSADGRTLEVARKTLEVGKSKAEPGSVTTARGLANRSTVGAVISATGSAPVYASEYGRSHAFTPQMYETVRSRDMTHALKNDEDRRYAEEKIKFDRMLGASAGGTASKSKGAAK